MFHPEGLLYEIAVT